MANHVDGINLMKWHYEDNGLGGISKETQVWSSSGMRKALRFVGGLKAAVK